MRSIGAYAATALLLVAASAQAHDAAKYPDLRGQWFRVGSGSFDPSKPAGLEQQAPLTDEYQKILEASLAEQAAGGQGNNPMGECVPPGLPRTMIDYEGMEVVITEDTTYILLIEPMDQIRRIYTDGRTWPAEFEPSFLGYSIGKWIDEDGDGRFDTLQIETRGIKPRHAYDSSGMPFHADGQAVIKERIYPDKTNRDVLHNEITIIDHALTRPWTVNRSYHRAAKAIWTEVVCSEDNHQIRIGNEHYYVNGDGKLMPTRKNQPPPDIRLFQQSHK